MRNHNMLWRVAIPLAFAAALCTAQERPAQPSGESSRAAEILEKSQQAFYYAGADLKAKVVMELAAASGQKRVRVLTMLRRNDAQGGGQRYLLFFHEPADVRRMAFLVWKYLEKDDDRWIFIPAMNMVRRVAASDSRSSFVGSDFTYEDVSGRDLGADAHTLLREETVGGKTCYVIQSVPRGRAEYSKKLAWIDKGTFLPVREEYFDAQGEMARVFTADKVEEIPANEGGRKTSRPVVTQRTMKNVKSGHKTVVAFSEVVLGIGLEESLFTERSLQNPPAKWVR